MSITCQYCKRELDAQANQCACGAVKQTGLIQRLAGGIAFAATLILLTGVMLLVAAIEPLAQRLYSDENMSSTIQMAIVGAVICMWWLRSQFRKPRWRRNGR